MSIPADVSVEEVIIFSTLSILQLIKDAQQQHGLRHGDYQRYRGYCSRKLQRVRRSLKLTASHRVKGGYQAKKLTVELVKDSRYLQIPLFDAERSWAYAMQLKQEANSEPRKRFYMVRRLRKAVEQAAQLDSLCRSLDDRIDARTRLEAQAYHAIMCGHLAFELADWKSALEHLTNAKTICEKLATAVPQCAELFQARVAELSPQLRYCQYNIGDASALKELVKLRETGEAGGMETELDALIEQTRISDQQAREKPVVKWAGNSINTEMNQRSRVFCASLAESQKRIAACESKEDKLAMYDRLIMDCREAIQALRDDCKTETLLTRRSDQVQTAASQAQLLHSFLHFIRLMKTTERYLLMIEGQGSTKPQDLVRPFDAIIQNLTEIETLPGADKDIKFTNIIQANLLYFRAQRLHAMSCSYAALGGWAESHGLVLRALTYIAEAEKLAKDSGLQLGGIELVSKAELSKLQQDCAVARYTALGNCVSHHEKRDSVEEANTSKPLDADLSTYRRFGTGKSAIPPLTSLPPDFLPMPVKPLFYDLALNHVTFPPLPQFKEGQTSPEDGEGGGVTGFVKGWLWGAKK